MSPLCPILTFASNIEHARFRSLQKSPKAFRPVQLGLDKKTNSLASNFSMGLPQAGLQGPPPLQTTPLHSRKTASRAVGSTLGASRSLQGLLGPPPKTQTPRPKIQNPKHNTRNPKSKIQRPNPKTQNPKGTKSQHGPINVFHVHFIGREGLGV